MWTYVVLSKWSDADLFRVQLGRQPVPASWVPVLFYALPGSELTIACLIAYRPSRLYGLRASLLLMCCFTMYVALALTNNIWEHRPCACGGILSHMGWRTHLWFNLIVTLSNAAAIYFQKTIRIHQRQKSGENSRSGLAGQKAKHKFYFFTKVFRTF